MMISAEVKCAVIVHNKLLYIYNISFFSIYFVSLISGIATLLKCLWIFYSLYIIVLGTGSVSALVER